MTSNAEFEEFYAGASGRLRLRDYEVPEAWGAPRGHEPGRRAGPEAPPAGPGLPPTRTAPYVPEVSVEALDLLQALRMLPVRQRQAIALHHLVGMPVDEVARTLSARSGTVKSALARGRRALAVLLDDLEEVPDPDERLA